MRLFVGIELNSEIKSWVRTFCYGARNVRWVREDNFHVTLSFIGEVFGRGQYGEIREILGDINASRFEINMRDIGFFREGKRPKSLWIGVEKSPELLETQKMIEKHLKNQNLKIEKRKYIPHITIGKAIDKCSVHDFANYMQSLGHIKPVRYTVNHFTLFSSERKSGGIHYNVEERFPLL